MAERATAPLRVNAEQTISVLAVVPSERWAEVKRILSHTRWQLRLVNSLYEAVQVMQDFPAAVVLCERRLPDGTWLDVLREAKRISPSPQTIVLSEAPDSAFWAEVVNYGGYDVLATPLEPKELYALVPMAWRYWSSVAEESPVSAAELKTMFHMVR